MSLSAADRLAADVLRQLGADPVSWVRESMTDHNVLIVGGGQAGIGIAFALRRAGIGGVSVIDAAAQGCTGAWTTIARMHTLRTPKAWPEPEFGVPGLSFRAWFETTRGVEAYDRLDRIPRLVWAEYVDWVTRALAVPVRHQTRLLGIAPAESHLVVQLEVTDASGTHLVEESTRKIVLANGIEGTGGGTRPAGIGQLPAHLAAHTGDLIDVASLAGRSVGVLGAGASAFDTASVALEAGAAEVHLFTRRPELLIQGPGGFPPGSLGARNNYARRSDAEKWEQKVTLGRKGRSTTLASVQRAAAHAGFHVHLNAGWEGTRVIERDGTEGVEVEAGDGTHVFDFVISGAGYQYDPRTRDDLAGIADHIALWEDRYPAPVGLEDAGLAAHPYLGAGFEFLEKHPGEAPWLSRIHTFSAAAGVSFGYPIGDVQSLAPEIPRLVDAIGRDLFFEDQALPAASAPSTAAPAPAEAYREVYAHTIWSTVSV